MNRFTSILIANRGEIACRVIRTAKEQGYKTVAVYSDADAAAPHVQLADQAVLIGAGPVGESYLRADKILEAARTSGAQAIHPGYGFLSENADFAEACDAAGLVFIGPSAFAINAMGNKAEAKRLMISANVPCVPGYEGEDQSIETLVSEGKKIGSPLMVKAAAGGGGRGMRLVNDLSELENAISLARNEAEGAFGSGELILERAIIKPRHVEVQVFADRHGHTVYLGERDCSIQRRHQKVVEEAPCPIMTETLREQMGKAAVEAAKSINYDGAGTVEFLLDQSGEFYFLEMNTRLQVEHPVTELITGLDLVALQLQVAQGDQLGISQEDVHLDGHAIEVRLYTEDPAQDFLPTSGPVTLWRPAEGEGIRIDGGICSGQDISPFYDPMVAKVIAYGSNREMARLRLIDALKRSCLFGTTTNKRFLIECLEKPAFAAGEATTAFIEEQFGETAFTESEPSLQEAAVAAVLAVQYDYDQAQTASVFVAPGLKNWHSAEKPAVRKHYVFGECEHNLFIHSSGADSYTVKGAEESVEVELLSYGKDDALVEVNGIRHQVDFFAVSDAEHFLAIEGRTLHFKDQVRLAGAKDGAGGGGSVIAPMHGMLLEIRVAVGDAVQKGQTLAILEAMKMHYEIQAEADGVVSEILTSAGTQVAADSVLIEIDLGDETE
ncbi:MAG: acetyl-CoA carboxylase biotin carboxylase subunit [Pseudomonadales bacterium]